MILIDVMHRVAAQMGKLYLGYGRTITTTPFVFQDEIIRMNQGDHAGGTLFLLDQTWTIQNTDINGNYTLIQPKGGAYTKPVVGTYNNYTMTDMDRSTLVNAINTALLAMGEHTTYQDFDVTATDHREFLLPIGTHTPLKIEFFNYVSDGFVFSDSKTWDLSVKDGQNVITFQNRIVPAETAKIRVWYNAPHPMVVDDDDVIDPDYHTRRLVYEAAYWGYFQFLAREHNNSDKDLLLYQSILQEREMLSNKHPVPRLLHRITLPRN